MGEPLGKANKTMGQPYNGPAGIPSKDGGVLMLQTQELSISDTDKTECGWLKGAELYLCCSGLLLGFSLLLVSSCNSICVTFICAIGERIIMYLDEILFPFKIK